MKTYAIHRIHLCDPDNGQLKTIKPDELLTTTNLDALRSHLETLYTAELGQPVQVMFTFKQEP